MMRFVESLQAIIIDFMWMYAYAYVYCVLCMYEMESWFI